MCRINFTLIRSTSVLILSLIFLGNFPKALFAESGTRIPIERAMREYQVRYQYLRPGKKLSWRKCICGTPAPAYPPDGFYDKDLEDPILATKLVQNLAAKFWDDYSDTKIFPSFVKDEYGDLEGKSDGPLHYTLDDMPKINTDDITPDNYIINFYMIYSYIKGLNYLSKYAIFKNGATRGASGYGYDCDEAKDMARESWTYVDWDSSDSLFEIAIAESSIYADVVEEADVNKEAWRGKVNVNLEAYHGPGTATIYLKVAPQEDGVSNNPPVDADEKWHSWASPSLGEDWISGYLASFEPVITTNCPIGQLVVKGWNLISGVCIIRPEFDPGDGDKTAKCKCMCSGGCIPGTVTSSLVNGVNIYMGLGTAERDKAVGYMWIHSDEPSAELATPAILKWVVSDEIFPRDIIKDENGYLRQLRTPHMLVDIVTNPDNYQYTISFYLEGNFGTSKVDGLYPINGPSYKHIVVKNVNAPADNNVLRVSEYDYDNLVRETTFVWNESEAVWELYEGSGNNERIEALKSVEIDPENKVREETYTIKNGAGQIVYKETRRFQEFEWGEEQIEKVVDPDGAALVTTWTYDNDSGSPTYGMLLATTEPNGYWKRYIYDADKRLCKIISQYLNASQDSDESQCKVEEFLYFNEGDNTIKCIITRILGQEVSRHYELYTPTANGMREIWDIECQSPGAPWNDPNNLVTKTKLYYGGYYDGKTISVEYSDGTVSLYDYDGAKTIVRTGKSENGSVTDGTRAETTVDDYGNVILRETYDIASGILLSREQATQQDEFGRPTEVTYIDGTKTETTYGCCGVTQQVDREGITTVYEYDELHRIKSTTRAGITHSYTYNVSGKLLSENMGSGEDAITVKTLSYDTAGRVISSADAIGRITHFSEEIIAGYTVKTTTYPDGSTRIEKRYPDGNLYEITGTAVHPMRYEYSVGNGVKVVKEIKLGSNGETTEWVKRYTDMSGRIFKIEYPDGAVELSYYNNKGQAIKRIGPDGVTTLYRYNNKGELEYTAIDMNLNCEIDFDGIDRITRTETEVLAAHDTNVRKTATTVWTNNNTNDTSIVSIRETSVDGLQTWITRNGLTQHTQISYDRANAAKTITVTNPDGSTVVSEYINGRLASVTRSAGGTQLSQQTYTYDAYGRTQSVNDAFRGNTSYTYDNANQILFVTTDAPGGGQRVTSYQYDARGRKTLITLPDGQTRHYEYYPTGELKKVYGVRTYPVEYTYDAQGRRKTMTTWKEFDSESGQGVSGQAITTWNYDPQRGWLISKKYNDNQGPTYTYTPAGRLKTRTWARNNLTTTYIYDNAGEQIGIDYSDDTPDITYTRDRRGRIVAVSDGAGNHTLTYNDEGKLTNYEVTDGVYGDGIKLVYSYDSLMRRNQLETRVTLVADINGDGVVGGADLNILLTYWGLSGEGDINGDGVVDSADLNILLSQWGRYTLLLKNTYTYDAASRILSITNESNEQNDTHNATYSYLPNSSIANSITLKTESDTVVTVTRSYDAETHSRLNAITSTPSVDSAISYTYTYNAADQRTQCDLADGSCWIYQYDELGQLKLAKRRFDGSTFVPGQQFEYTYDTIGNRTSVKVGGDEQGNNMRESLYSSNLLNQYINRTVPGSADIMGYEDADSTVTVNSYQTYRHNEYYHKTLSWDNTANPRYEQVDISVDGELAETRYVYIPKTPIDSNDYQYDADGNLIRDDRWHYSYDAENRLVEMVPRQQAISAGVPNIKLEFVYDYMGRRVAKNIYEWDEESSQYVRSSAVRFIYDGWRVVAEVTGISAHSNIPERVYSWGLDVSGGFSGAGGIGGLVFIDQYINSINTETYIPCYDGNGNLTGLVYAAGEDQGKFAAKYEYSPFGELLTKSGDYTETKNIFFRFCQTLAS